jgi:hypothetical protein
LLSIAVRTTDYAQQDAIPGRYIRGKIVSDEEDPFTGAAPHENGWNAKLSHEVEERLDKEDIMKQRLENVC